jgi:hypothetical protein
VRTESKSAENGRNQDDRKPGVGKMMGKMARGSDGGRNECFEKLGFNWR